MGLVLTRIKCEIHEDEVTRVKIPCPTTRRVGIIQPIRIPNMLTIEWYIQIIYENAIRK